MRVLLVESERRVLPAAHALRVGFTDAIIRTVDLLELDSALDTDLIIVARSPWNDDDTDLCRRLHTAGLTVPILAISGPCNPGQRAGALLAGADDFLAAPFEVDELAARAVALVRRASLGSRHARVGVFSVDFARRQILVERLPVQLTLREYDLLAKLIERAGEVVARRELTGLTAVASTDGESNAVDVHISRIRDKLGPHGSRIETVRGVGYRLRRS